MTLCKVNFIFYLPANKPGQNSETEKKNEGTGARPQVTVRLFKNPND